jgi:hypothetical protein
LKTPRAGLLNPILPTELNILAKDDGVTILNLFVAAVISEVLAIEVPPKFVQVIFLKLPVVILKVLALIEVIRIIYIYNRIKKTKL